MARADEIDDLYTEFKSQHNIVIGLISDEEFQIYDVMRISADKAYYGVKGIKNDFAIKDSTQISNQSLLNQSQSQMTSRISANLPKLNMPKFNGEYKNWPAFYDFFNSVIHNNSDLSDVDKFRHLRTLLEDEALSLIKGLPITDANYQVAYEALENRYDVVNINLYSKPDWYYNKSPYGKVPALEVENGEVLYESLVIADYLDEKYHAHQLHNKDPLQKAKDKLLIEQFNRVINTMYRVLMNVGRISLDDDETISGGLSTFENQLRNRGTPFFGGTKTGMLDLMIWPWVERADILKIFGNQDLLKKEKYKKLMEWSRRMVEEPSVKRSVMHSDTHVKYLQSYRAGLPDYDMILNSTD